MEQGKTLEVLRLAIQMEIDGKDYYLKLAGRSSNKVGKELLRALAGEEDIHRLKFEEIFRDIEQKKGWLRTDFRPDRGSKLRTIFAQAAADTSKFKAPASELDAVRTAMDMENRTYDFYESQSRKATYTAEKEYYEVLAAEEKGHHLILLDYYEYLKDPAGWFTHKEHPTLDGG